jgi:hypothetical protein
MESRESSSPVVTRSVSAALQNKTSEVYEFPWYQQLGLRLMGVFPQSVALKIIPKAQSPDAVDPALVRKLSVDHLIRERLKDYDSLTGQFPSITMGVAMGGTSAHIAAALRGPFLPQAFVISMRGGSPTGNIEVYFNRSTDLSLQIAQDNPGIMTIQHYDPVHDGWLTRYVNHLRLKLVDLPEAYKEFIRARLEPGGAVYFLDGQASWLRYRLGERSVFQVGGWGGIPPEEFIQGSDRIRKYCRTVGMTDFDWTLKDYHLERGPESEWGCEPGLAEAVESFCQQEGYRFIRISYSDPNDYSRLTFKMYEQMMKKGGQEPTGAVVEMFTQFDATTVLKGGLIPLWLIFNTQDSLEFLSEMTSQFPKRKPVFFSPLATFSITPDLVPQASWKKAFKDFKVINIGARDNHYPADTTALLDWARPLRRWVADHPQPITETLTPNEIIELTQSI